MGLIVWTLPGLPRFQFQLCAANSAVRGFQGFLSAPRPEYQGPKLEPEATVTLDFASRRTLAFCALCADNHPVLDSGSDGWMLGSDLYGQHRPMAHGK